MTKYNKSLPVVEKVLPVGRALEPASKNKGELSIEKMQLSVDVADEQMIPDLKTFNFSNKLNLSLRVQHKK